MKITTIEKRIDELEQYSRMDNHISYSRAASQSNSVEINENCPIAEINSCEEQVVSFLTSKFGEISINKISICHTVKTKINKQQIVIKFNNRKTKKRVSFFSILC